MSEAPAELWMRQRPAPGHGWYQTALAPLEGAGVVRYVRADLYEALQARLADALKECADDLAAEIAARYAGTLHYPVQQHGYDRDMASVVHARALLEPLGTDFR